MNQANSTEFEIRPLGLVVKRITSIAILDMIRSLVRFWQRAAFFVRMRMWSGVHCISEVPEHMELEIDVPIMACSRFD